MTDPAMMTEIPQILRLVGAMALVLALMGGLALFLKKLGRGGASLPAPKKRRLKLIESLPLDARRRLVILQRDARQHLVILGASGETVIETNIESPPEETESAS